MDIDHILSIIPRMIHEWNQKDVEVWLTYIQLPQLIPKFKTYRIDGNRLLKISKQYLSSTLIIESNIMRKKIYNWIQYLVQLQPYCHEQLKRLQVQNTPQIMKRGYKHEYLLSNAQTLDDEIDNDCYSLTDSSETTITKQFIDKDSNTIRYSYIPDHQTLHIYEKTSNQKKYYTCDQTSITIGRSSQNSICVVEADVQANHCTIIHRQNHHYLISSLRNSGVWTKITRRVRIQKKCIIQMGQLDFHIIPNKNQLLIHIFEVGFESERHIFNGHDKSWIRVGRRNNCDIIKPQDTTLSGYHGKFTFDEDEKWSFEDLQTTNGSWLRCMDQVMMTDKMIFRIGKSTCSFESRIYANDECKSNSSTSSELGTCRNCRNCQKNSYFKPCYHNQYCASCAEFMQFCPICYCKIKKVEKIYKL